MLLWHLLRLSAVAARGVSVSVAVGHGRSVRLVKGSEGLCSEEVFGALQASSGHGGGTGGVRRVVDGRAA